MDQSFDRKLADLGRRGVTPAGFIRTGATAWRVYVLLRMTVGSKVVCIDDKFPLGIEKFYTALPKAGVVYVIREMTVGISLQGEEGEVCVLLVGLNNPRSSKAPFPERGFKAERFRPLDEIKEENAKKETEGAGVLVESISREM
jgi:hypothetical protein